MNSSNKSSNINFSSKNNEKFIIFPYDTEQKPTNTRVRLNGNNNNNMYNGNNQFVRRNNFFGFRFSSIIYFMLFLTFILFVAGIVAYVIWISNDPDHHDLKKKQDNQDKDKYLYDNEYISKRRISRNNNRLIKSRTSNIDDSSYKRNTNNDIEFSEPSNCPVGQRPDLSNNEECNSSLFYVKPLNSTVMDTNSNPCTNFYRFACGNFNENKGMDATFKHLYKSNRELLHDIIINLYNEYNNSNSYNGESNNNNNNNRIGMFFSTCLSYNSDKDIGLKSIIFKSLIKMIDEHLETHRDLEIIFGKLQLYNVITPVTLSFEINPLNAGKLIPLINQGGLFDSDLRSIYSNQHLETITSRLRKFYSREAELGFDDKPSEQEIRSEAMKIVKIEKSLIPLMYKTKSSNVVQYVLSSEIQNDILENWKVSPLITSMNKQGFSLENFLIHSKPLNIKSTDEWIRSIQESKLWVHSKSYFSRIVPVLQSHSIDAWKSYLKHSILFELVDDSIPKIDIESHYAYHKSYDSRYSLPWNKPKKFTSISSSSSSSDQTRSDQCVFLTEAYLPVLLDNYFIESGLDQYTIEDVQSITETIKSEFLKEIDRSFNYLSYREKQKITKKMRSIHIQIGEPSSINRDNLIINHESFVENILSIRKYHLITLFNLFHNQFKQDTYNDDHALLNPDLVFDQLTSVVNAFYQHQINTITVNAGILKYPIYSKDQNKIIKYSRLGVILAHEFTHSIDKMGMLFDSNGSINPMLSSQSTIEIDKRYSCFKNMYNKVTNLGNIHDGSKTLNENVADNTGFLVAYNSLFSNDKEFSISLSKRQLVDRKREFYLSYAQLFCESVTKKQEAYMIRTRSHSVSSMRVNNVLMNHKEFRNTWDCPRIPPEITSIISTQKKCSILV